MGAGLACAITRKRGVELLTRGHLTEQQPQLCPRFQHICWVLGIQERTQDLMASWGGGVWIFKGVHTSHCNRLVAQGHPDRAIVGWGPEEGLCELGF